MRKATLGVVFLLGAVLVLAVGCPQDMALQSAAGGPVVKNEPGTCTFMMRKFNDLNGNGVLDANDPPLDEEILEWPVYWQTPAQYGTLEFQSDVTPVWCLEAEGQTGTWSFWEGSQTGWEITGVLINWEPVINFMDVIEIDVTGAAGEAYEIIFLNTQNGNGEPPEDCNLLIRKINDLNKNGEVDPGEPEIEWPVAVTNPDYVTTNVMTPECINAGILGVWSIDEDETTGWYLTGVYVNGVAVIPPDDVVEVDFTCQEEFEIVFLNAQTCPPPPDGGRICAKKVYDAEGDGCDPWDPPIEGFLLCLTGTTTAGVEIGPLCEYTNCDGVVCWDDLDAGWYRVCEVLPCGEWYATTPECVEVDLCAGETEEVCFANFCAKTIDMRTKGWWQNRHGCAAIAENPELLDALNSLAPFQSGTFYTNGRDQCTGDRCQTVVLPFDSNSELGCFIVAPNSQSRVLQLMQQLAAFVLNVQYQTGSLDLYFPMLEMTAQEIVDAAIDAWMTGTDVCYWSTVLDRLNNACEIYIVSPKPCEILYDEIG